MPEKQDVAEALKKYFGERKSKIPRPESSRPDPDAPHRLKPTSQQQKQHQDRLRAKKLKKQKQEKKRKRGKKG